MEKFTCNNFIDFVDSNLNELEYFNYDNKDDLISLNEYLAELKHKKEEFELKISEPLDSIQKKNRWVKKIIVDDKVFKNQLIVLGRSEPTLGLGIQNNSFVRVGGCVVKPFHYMKLKNRLKIIENSQEELHQINNIIQNMQYYENDVNTISGNFTIKHYSYDRVCIWSFGWPVLDANVTTGEFHDIKYWIAPDIFYQKEGYYPDAAVLKDPENLARKLYIKK